jgi:sugar phosphate isomerase/epimerase
VSRTAWGLMKVEGGTYESLDAWFASVKKSKSKIVEMPLVSILDYGKDKFSELLSTHDLKVIALCFSDGFMCPGERHGHPDSYGESVTEHFNVLKHQFNEIFKHTGLRERTIYINCHTGSDFFSQKQSIELFHLVADYEKDLGVDMIGHETHRSRSLYSPWVVRDMLPHLPSSVKFTADLSHWITVCERPLNDKRLNEIIDLIIPRVRHIHARVGHEQSIQVSDPRSEEWTGHVQGFLEMWTRIWKYQVENKIDCTVLCEHGPFPYQPSLPHNNNTPLANLEEVNDFICTTVKEKFETIFKSE